MRPRKRHIDRHFMIIKFRKHPLYCSVFDRIWREVPKRAIISLYVISFNIWTRSRLVLGDIASQPKSNQYFYLEDGAQQVVILSEFVINNTLSRSWAPNCEIQCSKLLIRSSSNQMIREKSPKPLSWSNFFFPFMILCNGLRAWTSYSSKRRLTLNIMLSL